jgi:hypothetical protein
VEHDQILRESSADREAVEVDRSTKRLQESMA